ncbi:uncharacterized protein LOC143018176 isoform X1 [Oratosquilla oratoria]|uniref:uncharacterized protein LOC143018176 isoform X1 n=1 Tax=Oratosquilla oratoria TaxID=337810 RepID=UPI003F76A402
MAYRSAKHEATGFTPAKLMFGREIRLPVDLSTGRPPGAELPHTYSDYVMMMQRRLEEVSRWARQHLRVSGQAMWRQYQGRARNAEHQPGDMVWLHNPQRKPGKSPKLQSDWEGPYKVTEVISAVNYRLEMPGRKRASKVAHVDRLWKHPGEGEFIWGERDVDSRDSDSGSSSCDDGDHSPSVEREYDSDTESDEGVAHEDEVERDQRPGRPPRNRKLPAWLTDYVIDI